MNEYVSSSHNEVSDAVNAALARNDLPRVHAIFRCNYDAHPTDRPEVTTCIHDVTICRLFDVWRCTQFLRKLDFVTGSRCQAL